MIISAKHSCAAFCSSSSFGSGVPEVDEDDDVIFRLRFGDDADWLRAPLPPNMWNREGAKQTARLLAFIWFCWECEAISLRKRRRDWSTSRLSSGRSIQAHCTASNRSSGGTSGNTKKNIYALGSSIRGLKVVKGSFFNTKELYFTAFRRFQRKLLLLHEVLHQFFQFK